MVQSKREEILRVVANKEGSLDVSEWIELWKLNEMLSGDVAQFVRGRLTQTLLNTRQLHTRKLTFA